jgi:catalase
LGANFNQLPVNCPYRVSVKNYQRDGPACYNDNQGGAPNYYPNSFSGPEPSQRTVTLQAPYKLSGDVQRFDSGNEDNFSQATIFWEKVLDKEARKRLVSNISGHLVNAKEFIQERAINNFSQVSAEFGQQLREAIKLKKSAKM